LYDALEQRWQTVRVNKDPQCPVCGDNPTVTELIDYEQFCGVPANDHQIDQDLATLPEITPIEFEKIRDQVNLIDVREPHEYEISQISGSKLIPLGDLMTRVNELDSADQIVFQCRSGARSAQAQQLLWDAGFRKTYNLVGGINRYARDVDPSIPTY
jgi:adenylyltransferase/sulfurtransferase